MYKVGILGHESSVLPYMASGFLIFSAENKDATLTGLNYLVEKNCAIIFVTEELMTYVSDEISKYKNSPIPAIIAIPGANGTFGYGTESIRHACIKALGIDLTSQK